MRRNRIRHRLIPYIRFHFNPRIDQALARWSEIVHAENIYMANVTKAILFKIEVLIKNYKNTICLHGINLYFFRSLPTVLQRRILRHYLYKYIHKNLSFQFIEHVRLYCLMKQSWNLTYKKNNLTKDGLVTHNCLFLPGNYKLKIVHKSVVCLIYN